MTSPTTKSSHACASWLSGLRPEALAFLTPAERREWDSLSRPRAPAGYADYASDPLGLARLLWPGVRFYDRQEEIILSVRDNSETFVPAAHQVGKDFVSGFAALWFFLCHHPCRVVTTSVKDDHLRVLWGEIGRFIDAAAFPLTRKKGGPLIVNHRDIRKLGPGGKECKISYLRGMVSETGEGMAGHHAAHTFLIVDEASGVDDLVYERADTWAKRKLVIGNPYQTSNFFYQAVKQGGLPGARRVIRIRAEDSPNVRRGLARGRGEPESSWPAVVPGVLSYAEYQDRRGRWDVVRQTVGLDAAFYEGAENLLFPPAWLARAERMAERLLGRPRKAEAIGIDPGEGASETSMCAVDRLGLIELVARRTPDTSAIRREALAFLRKHGVPADCVGIDAGGGGRQIADDLRADGHPVRLVAFGGAPAPVNGTGPVTQGERREACEDRLAYVTLRDQMYGELRLLLDPEGDPLTSVRETFAIPAEYAELRRQLAPIPLTYDREGRLKLLPKRKPGKNQGSGETLVGLLGCSPDQADSLCVAVHLLLHRPRRIWVGAIRT